MNYSPYPITQADFYRSQVRQQLKEEQEMSPEEFKQYEQLFIPHQQRQISLIKQGNGLVLRNFKESTTPSVFGGYYKPVAETCTQITGLTGPEESTTSLFNNMTRRKSVVKDY